jgi:hypothetical protein
MGIPLKWTPRRLTRWAIGLVLLPVAVFILILFLVTGHPVPNKFISFDDLGLDGDWKHPSAEMQQSSKRISFQGNRGRCCVTLRPIGDASTEGLLPSQDVIATVTDNSTLERLGSFRCKLSDCSYCDIDPDRSYLIAVGNRRFHAWRLHADRETADDVRDNVQLPDSIGPEFAFAPDGRQLLIYANSWAVLYDRLEWKQVAQFTSLKGHPFFDAHSKPKVLTPRGLRFQPDADPMVRDLISNRQDTKLEGFPQCDAGESSSTDIICVSGVPIATTYFWNSRILQVHSLQNGQLLHGYRLPPIFGYLRGFKSDGRFVVLHFPRRHALVRWARDYNQALEQWLNKLRPDREGYALLDLQDGTTWHDFLGDKGCSLSHDGSTLVSFTDTGRYEYDVPPRWQYFTPWAWVALGAWMGLATVWWKLGKRRPA